MALRSCVGWLTPPAFFRRGGYSVSVLICILMSSMIAKSQVSNGNTQAPPVPKPLPIPTQIKKTIVFLESDCLHDFSPELAEMTPEKVANLPHDQQRALHARLRVLTWQLRQVKAGASKLTKAELETLQKSDYQANTPDTQIADDTATRARLLLKMMNLSNQELRTLTDQELSLMPLDNWRGTGFLIGLVDPRLKMPPGQAGLRFFRYVVTNRHVIEPGVEKNSPCKVAASYILMNHKPDAQHSSKYVQTIRIDKLLKWVTPRDESVDLAAASIGYSESDYDHIVIPSTEFATADEIQNHGIVEGDPILYAGLFIQTFDAIHTLEPIVRSGSLAMVPEALLPTTLAHRPGHILLTDAHVFGGNSGSPVFVDPNKYAGFLTGPSLKLLGVVSGEVFEGADLTLNVTTSITGNIAANSGVSVVVPVTELMDLLNQPELSQDRDRVATAESNSDTAKPN